MSGSTCAMLKAAVANTWLQAARGCHHAGPQRAWMLGGSSNVGVSGGMHGSKAGTPRKALMTSCCVASLVGGAPLPSPPWKEGPNGGTLVPLGLFWPSLHQHNARHALMG